MKYRRFGQLDWEVSALGFGVRNLPISKNSRSEASEVESVKMIDYAINHGINYLDLGGIYYTRQSERLTRFVSQVLQDGYGEKIKVAITLSSLLINSHRDFNNHLNKQLQWLQMDTVDFFLFGGLNYESWTKIQKLGALQWAEGALCDGRIGKLGFSFHDDFQVLKNILNAYDNWTFCQFRYSYMDVDHHPGTVGLEYAAEKGMAVIIAEPLLAGRLTQKLPDSVATIWENTPRKLSAAEWGLRAVWNQTEVTTVVSDMSSMEQLVENITLADRVEPDNLTIEEEVSISCVREAYQKLRPVRCTTCRICMPCPRGIDVPRIFELYNDAIIYSNLELPRLDYRIERHDAGLCSKCGVCVKKCPRKIPILRHLKTAHQILAKEE